MQTIEVLYACGPSSRPHARWWSGTELLWILLIDILPSRWWYCVVLHRSIV